MHGFTFLIAFIVALVIWVVATYNKVIQLIEEVNNNAKQIDIQLDRRYKVLESLLNVVKNYMEYEKTTLKEVVALRQQAQQAQTNNEQTQRMAAEEEISKITARIGLVVEQYPQLKASENMLNLQEEIVSTENKLAYAKQAYNDSIERYNATKKGLLVSLLVARFSKQLDQEFIYWQLPAGQRVTQELYIAKL